ncbi:CinA family protein [Nocardioides guangzhouensis]|uniref:CinA family protein n=1 Tax=Nocardioides guangzhouensis TaxID=2497878 RepID=UPI0014382D07|nr:nicotinamide-nucleotide amidohydrolase family protein [Nocardioides guangzhouensis]
MSAVPEELDEEQVTCRTFRNHGPSEATPLEVVARVAQDSGLWVATVESLTSGRVASRLGEGENASTWFRGGIVAYDEQVKVELLGVDTGELVSTRCAEQMATGAARVLRADAVVALTGVGGPGPDEDKPPGTVVMAVRVGDVTTFATFLIGGPPDEVVAGATDRAVELLASALRRQGGLDDRVR